MTLINNAVKSAVDEQRSFYTVLDTGNNRLVQSAHCQQRWNPSDGPSSTNKHGGSHRTRPTCLIPLLVVFALFAAVVVTGTTSIIVTTYTSVLQGSLEGFLDTYGTETTDRIAYYIVKHWVVVRQAAVVAERACNQLDLMPNASDPTQLLKWFGRHAYDIDVRFGYYHTEVINGSHFGTAGICFQSYSLLHPALIPRRPPYIVVETQNGVSQEWASAYYNMTTWAPASPLYHSVIPFAACSTPWGPACNRSLFWTAPYVSFVTSSSAVAIAGKCTFFSAQENRWRSGVFVFADFTQDIVTYFSRLKISATGAALLVDVVSRAFVGGNIPDRITITQPGSGSAASRTRLAQLEDLTDYRIAPVVQASKTGGKDLLMTCTAPCAFVYGRGDDELSTTVSYGLWMFRDFDIVRVVDVRDGYGIHMRLITVLPARDFTGELQDACIRGVIIAACVIAGLLVLVTGVLHALLTPLHVIEKVLQSLAFTAGSDLAGLNKKRGIIAPHLFAATANMSRLKEVRKLEAATVRLVKELDILTSYLPPQVSRMLRTACGAHNRDVENERSLSSSTARESSSLQTTASEVNARDFEEMMFLHGSRWIASPSVTTVATFIAGDVQGFHSTIQALVPVDVPALHKILVDVVQASVQAHGGTFALFYGDHIYAHFNAASRLKKHAAAACRAVLQIAEELASMSLPQQEVNRDLQSREGPSAAAAAPLRMRIGVSTGQCIAQCTPSKASSIVHVIGPCVSQAVALCSTLRSAASGSRHLLSVHTVRLLKGSEFVVKHARIVVLRQETTKSCASVVLRSASVSAERRKQIVRQNEAFEKAMEEVAAEGDGNRTGVAAE